MILSIRPITSWPGELRTHSQRVSSPFNSSYSDTLELLGRELRMLEANAPTVQLAVNEGQILRDGRLRARAYPDHPGVILSFQTARGSFRYAGDRFPHWHDNLRGIALALESLRKIERYGVGSGTEQYTGYLQLESGPASEEMSYGEALDVVAGLIGASRAKVRQRWQYADSRTELYRQALKAAHPDTGGVPGMFSRLLAARLVLDAGES